MASESDHGNSFDFLRFLAATMVWYSHCYALTGGRDQLNMWLPFQSFGGLGVAIFFVISGYFITASYQRHGRLLPFLRNRILRIMPALILVVLASVLLMGPLVTSLSAGQYFSNSQTWRYLRTMLIFPLQYELPGVFQNLPNHAVNGSLWTLQHEARCYLVIGFFGMLGILHERFMIAFFLGLGAILVYGAICGSHPPETLFTVRWGKLQLAVELGFLFMGGSLVYMFRSSIPRHIGFFTAGILLLVLSAKLPPLWAALMIDLTLIYMIIYLGFLQLPVIGHFGRYGDFSYGMYLYAFPVQQLTLSLLHSPKTPTASFLLISFAATLLCAITSWHLVEKKALHYKV